MVQDDPKNAHRMDVFGLRDQCEPGHGCQRTPPVPRLRLDNLQQRIRECDKTRKECIPTVTAAYEKPKEAVRGFGLNCWETFCHAFTPICCEGSLSAPVGNCYRTRLSVGEVVVASNVAVAAWDGDDTSEESSLPDSLKYQFATGNWGIDKAGKPVRTGVSQGLNRLTFMATLSHLRRMITPLARSGKLAKPRQLHNTHWGLVCPAETPEGQAVGLVKNISLMCYVSLGSKQTIIEDFLDEWGVLDLMECSPEHIKKYAKVFLNGMWVGMHERP